MPLIPVAMYGLEVPCGDILVPAVSDFPATVSTHVYTFSAYSGLSFAMFAFLPAKISRGMVIARSDINP